MGDKNHKIIDGDGHVVEDHSAIAARMPQQFRDRFGVEPQPLPAERSPSRGQCAFSPARRLRQSRARGLDRFYGGCRTDKRRALSDQWLIVRPCRQPGLGDRACPRL